MPLVYRLYPFTASSNAFPFHETQLDVPTADCEGTEGDHPKRQLGLHPDSSSRALMN